MRHAQKFPVMKIWTAAMILLATVCGFPGIGWSQTVIKTIQDLQNIKDNLSGSYILGNDIDATGFNFTPIGCYGVCPNGSAFTGTLNGNGHTITNLTISTTLTQAGLFFQVGSSGKVANLGLTNVSVHPTGFSSIGGIAGVNAGSITNSYVTGVINGVTGAAGGLVGANDLSGEITQSYANVAITGTGTGGIQLGGLVGSNNGTISESYTTGTVTGSTAGIGSTVGGLVGYSAGAIQNSYSLTGITGADFNPIGGLVGENASTISQSYAAGRVRGSAKSSIGGLVGFAFLPQGVAIGSYWDSQTTGQSTSAGGSALATAQLKSGSLPTGFDPTVWVAIVLQYPQLQSQLPAHPAFPVVLVHGICSTQATWQSLSSTLIKIGWNFGGSAGDVGHPLAKYPDPNHSADGDFYTVTFSNPEILGGLQAWVLELQNYLNVIKSFRRAPQNTKFIVMAHSAGGLAARSYLQSAGYQSDIAHLITYGTPHTGIPTIEGDVAVLALALSTCSDIDPSLPARVAILSDSIGLKDMIAGSGYLQNLNNTGFPKGVSHTSLIGTADDVAQLSQLRALPPPLNSLCPLGSDCVVTGQSQNLKSILNPPQSVVIHAVTDRTHMDFLPFIGNVPAETEDVTSMLWAIRRSVGAP